VRLTSLHRIVYEKVKLTEALGTSPRYKIDFFRGLVPNPPPPLHPPGSPCPYGARNVGFNDYTEAMHSCQKHNHLNVLSQETLSPCQAGLPRARRQATNVKRFVCSISASGAAEVEWNLIETSSWPIARVATGARNSTASQLLQRELEISVHWTIYNQQSTTVMW
jgi:hypothetical protein